MPFLNSEKIKQAFTALGQLLAHPGDELSEAMSLATYQNAWFTPEMIAKAIQSIHKMLDADDLEEWFKTIKVTDHPKRIGLILAGNIPMVGFHDVLAVLATGNIALIKLSSSDEKLLPVVLKQLIAIEPAFETQIIYTERLQNFDAVIATGSNNSSRYFEYYFSKVPYIIRKNRNSVAVLTGNEQAEDISLLGNDIFDYFGLGCRNVSKIYIPEGYDISNFFKPLEQFQPIINHFKYNNNYDYNKSIYLVNSVKHYDNGFLLLKEDETQTSPLAVLFYEQYQNIDEVETKLINQSENIQCVVSQANIKINAPVLNFGSSQEPKLWDYADNVNTIDFLNNLSN